MHHSFKRTLLAILIALSGSCAAWAQIVGGESTFRVAPAITGDRGRVFVGTQRGTILIGASTNTEVTVVDSIVRTGAAGANAVLPAELRGVWYLSMPNRSTHPDLIVALVTYSDGSANRYGVLRSTDFGVSWTLIKDPALANPMFIPTNNFWASTTLREIRWLPDAAHGWIYGPKGIAATTDGGLTWELRYTEGRDSSNHVQAMAFRDSLNGVASIGWAPLQRLHISYDGGRTWSPRRAPEGTHRVNQIDWVGNQYRAFVFDRSALSHSSRVTTYIYKSTDLGESWTSRAVVPVTVEQTYHSEILWADDQRGVMIMRSGEIAGTTNGGTTWSIVQNADSANYPLPIDSARAGQSPLRRGFGYASIILDGTKIVQASTLRADGELYRLIQWNLVTSGVRDELRIVTNASTIPTPARDRVRLELEHALSTSARVSIVDAIGRSRRVLSIDPGARSLDIDVSDLASGQYRVVVDDRERRVIAPVVIMR